MQCHKQKYYNMNSMHYKEPFTQEVIFTPVQLSGDKHKRNKHADRYLVQIRNPGGDTS